ncbi:matrixin family metalloprotease [Mycolicibacterium llatzerense]|uniref:matrixin family metalloprotease n=1 Tax=Mycolicibacterium llatzerense TaxID=280871 RepID=UPI0013A6D928|nr:matrixin family metalloprotease [Mycolicibacterium llatzerense]
MKRPRIAHTPRRLRELREYASTIWSTTRRHRAPVLIWAATMALIYHLLAGVESLGIPPMLVQAADHDSDPATAAAASASASATKFPWIAKRNNGLPVSWPCGPIHYRLILDGAPGGSDQLVHDALSRISEVSGYEFQQDSLVAADPGEDYAYAGIDIAWVSEAEFRSSADHTAIANGGSSRPAGGAHYRHGMVQLLRTRAGNMRTDFNYDNAGPVLPHELGHVLGLGHTTNPAGVMYPTELGVSTWTPAESAALRYLQSLCD